MSPSRSPAHQRLEMATRLVWMSASLFKSAFIAIPLLAIVAALGGPPLQAAPAPPGSASSPTVTVDYHRDIKPILKERCWACHGALKQEWRLRLDTAASIRKGGDSGAIIEPGKPEESILIDKIADPDPETRMPPMGPPLTADQIAKFKAWIAAGAEGPANETPERDPRDHWAFRPPARSVIPRVVDPLWAINPIDAFTAASRETRGLGPAPPASPSILLRRVYLDLIGMPPTREELRAFLADSSPDAYETTVDRLLASPRYGERWARHWMDVWRYSDWHGRRQVPDVWNSAPQIWRWRDWIVNSLNRDKGYDRMVMEMLAADEIAPVDEANGVATGYLVRNWYALNHNQWMRDNVEHTAKAFLGLTFNCAHCHDHKYDPIAQNDYFRFRAFFEPIGIRQDRAEGEADPGPFQEYQYSVLRKIVRLGTARIYDKTPDAPTWFYTGGDERNRVKERGSIAPGVPASLGGPPIQVKPVTLPTTAYYPGLREAILKDDLDARRSAIAKAETATAAARQAAEPALPALRETLADAEAELDKAAADARSQGQAAAVGGRRSLIVDAERGRRLLVINNALLGLKGIEEGLVFRFRLLILKDAHVNLQLAKDKIAGLTASCVAWEKGRILSYKPGGTAEFEAGRYDFAAGQNQFDIELAFEPKADRCALTIRSAKDGKVLADRVPVALNGWDPARDAKQAISLDVRTGCVAAWDDLRFETSGSGGASGSPASTVIDFEGGPYRDGADVLEIAGWEPSSFSSGPSSSRVGMTLDAPSLRAARAKRQAAQAAVDARELAIAAASAQEGAARAELASLEARVAADRAKHKLGPPASSAPTAAGLDLEKLAERASRAEREAALKSAEAEGLASRQAVAEAEAKPESDANRAKALEAANKRADAARTAVKLAKAALDDPAKARTYSPLSSVYPQESSGRRKMLAEWIADRRNPLTARVAVNHIWMRHFHAPLVASVFDFGRNGAKPSHPELLDWLAVELMESNWSMKRIHHLIVTSRTYRMATSGGDPRALAIDPENLLLWRMNPGRMEAEAVRDSLLNCAGELDLTMGGQELENPQALATFRRSLYYSCHPEDGGKSELGVLFDAPDANECYRRTKSVVPQQALALTNSRFVHERARKAADRLWTALPAAERTASASTSATARFITSAFEQILSRPPTAAEADLCAEFLKRRTEALIQRKIAPDEAQAQARQGLTRSLFNHNDFLTIR